MNPSPSRVIPEPAARIAKWNTPTQSSERHCPTTRATQPLLLRYCPMSSGTGVVLALSVVYPIQINEPNW
jgi:hypothetical protein